MTAKLNNSNLSVEKALRIIEIMADNSDSMRLQDIANSAGLPASTALRLIATLEKHQYIHQDPINKRYYLSLKLFYLGSLVSSNIEIRSIANPYLKELSSQLNCSVNLAIEQDNEAFILDVVGGSTEPTEITTQIGRKVPLYCTGIGKSLLLDFDDERLNNLFCTKPLIRYTPLTIIDKKNILEELKQIRGKGFSIDKGEYRPGIIGVAAPIFNRTGHIIAAISVADLASNINTDVLRKKCTAIIKTANEISKKI